MWGFQVGFPSSGMSHMTDCCVLMCFQFGWENLPLVLIVPAKNPCSHSLWSWVRQPEGDANLGVESEIVQLGHSCASKAHGQKRSRWLLDLTASELGRAVHCASLGHIDIPHISLLFQILWSLYYKLTFSSAILILKEAKGLVFFVLEITCPWWRKYQIDIPCWILNSQMPFFSSWNFVHHCNQYFKALCSCITWGRAVWWGAGRWVEKKMEGGGEDNNFYYFFNIFIFVLVAITLHKILDLSKRKKGNIFVSHLFSASQALLYLNSSTLAQLCWSFLHNSS